MINVTFIGQNEMDEKSPVTIYKESRSQNFYTFEVQHEDHTLGNMLTDQLLSQKEILFAGYRIEHPTKDLIKIRVHSSRTVNNAAEIIETAIGNLKDTLSRLSAQFEVQLNNFQVIY